MKTKLLLIASIMVLAVSQFSLAQVGKKGEIKPTPTPTPIPTTPKKSTPAKKSQPARKVTRSTGQPRQTAPAKDTAPAVNDAAANERTFWESIRNSTDAEDFREYLRQYPQGQFAGLARNRLRQLEAKPASASGATTASPPTAAKTTGAPTRGTIVRNQIGMEFVYVPAGSFMMGSTNNSTEQPVHQVTIRAGFYMGRYEVTQAQWRAMMGTNPSVFRGDNLPVENVSWNEAQEFIRKLNARGDGYTYRLPSEAEWEYACRAGTTTAFALGDSLSSEQANFNGTYPYGGAAKGVDRQKTSPVGSFQPNGWGLYDMHGNVWEWCEDWYNEHYVGAPVDGSAWLNGIEQYRRQRGGSWANSADDARSAYRSSEKPAVGTSASGFRVVAVVRM